MSNKRVWKNADGSINIYTGNDKKAKKAVAAVAEGYGFKAVDLVDQIAIEPTNKSELVKKLNEELKDLGLEAVAKTVEASNLKEYLSDYADMTDSPALKDYLGRMGDQAENLDHKKATHDLKDCVEEAESEYTNEEIDFLRNLSYLSGHEIKDLLAGSTSIDVLLDPEDLEKFINLDKATARKIEQKDIDLITQRAGSGILKHAMFSDEFTEKRKVAALKQALLNTANNSGFPISDFAMWMASDEAALLADEFYPEVAGFPMGNLSDLSGVASKLFENSINHYFKNMDRDAYDFQHDEFEEKLGRQSRPKSAPLIKKIKHLFKAS